MKITSVFGAVVAGAIVAAGVAFAGNFSSNHREDYFAAGTHEFYMWCARKPDYLATEKGASARDAQTKLYNKLKREGDSTCWPVWQGRLSG